MGRNRTVSSSAIARAVSDAAAGEYASAIETLVTAISLIKQSKVAADDRCKILISSLQDTLRGVETKSYGSGRRGKLNICLSIRLIKLQFCELSITRIVCVKLCKLNLKINYRVNIVIVNFFI